jgi:hypothetical protein
VTDTARAPHGFQPASRRRHRIAAGVALAAVAIGGNALVYSNLDDARPVVQVTRDVPAGTQISADMLRPVDVDADGTVNLVDAGRMDGLIGSHAKVRLVAGSLITWESVQDAALVSDGSAVVAIQVDDGRLPHGVRERVPVLLVIPAASGSSTSPIVIEGRVVGLPSPTGSVLGTQSLSVEVDAAQAATVAAADDVRVVLAEPSADPASRPSEPPTMAGEP